MIDVSKSTEAFTSGKLQAGSLFPNLHLSTIHQKPITVPDSEGRFVHLQFQRFAGCPICNLHLRSFAKRIGEITQANIREVVVFHSSIAAMLPYQGELPFDAVADPEKTLYRRFGVESSPLAKMHPKVFADGLMGMFVTKPATVVEGGTNGLPADFLIAPDGKIVAVKYGKHAADDWSVDELIALAK